MCIKPVAVAWAMLLFPVSVVIVMSFTFADFESCLDKLAEAIHKQGYLVLDGALPAHLSQALLDEWDQHFAVHLQSAGVGRAGDYRQSPDIRRDKILWLEPETPAVTEFLSWMDKLRTGLNQRLFLGLFDYESHFALYEPGDFYQKHRDAFRDTNARAGRKLSTVYYLNPDWTSLDGGELVLYDEADEHLLERVAPKQGRLLVFLSEDFPHEVLPARRPRKSIAGWFRVKPV